MQPLMKNLSGRGRNLPVVYVLFFVAFYLFLRLFVKTELVYYYFEMTCKWPFFKTGWEFLQDCLSYPGGPSQYIAAFLTQMLYYPWIGALCITLIAYGIFYLTVRLTRIPKDSYLLIVCFIPAILILMICGRYENPLSTATALLIVAFFSFLYEKISLHLGWFRVISFFIISGILFYVTGVTTLVFILLAFLFEYFNRDKPLLACFNLLLGLTACWLVGIYVFKLELKELYIYSNPFVETRQNFDREKWARIFEMILFVFIPIVVLLSAGTQKAAQGRHTSRQLRRGHERDSKAIKKILDNLLPDKYKWTMQTAMLALIAAPSFILSLDLKYKRVFQVGYFTNLRKWPQVLDVVKKGPLEQYFPFCNNAVNRALYYTDRLGDEMFTYPQNYRNSDLVFCPFPRGDEVYMERSVVCLDLGLVNVAEELAFEFLQMTDDSPYILKQLALISIVKRQMEEARVYLGALSKNPIYHWEARDILQRLESDPELENDGRIQYLRSVMMTDDRVYVVHDEEFLLNELLRRNRYNKMAFEYLMAHYLLNRQLDKLVENLPRLNDFGYENIPWYYQEAIMLYIGITRKSYDAGGRQIDAEVIRQYNEFFKISQNMNNRELMHETLREKFANTYFFYYMFGYSEMLQ
jgi:hypothetical protein